MLLSSIIILSWILAGTISVILYQTRVLKNNIYVEDLWYILLSAFLGYIIGYIIVFIIFLDYLNKYNNIILFKAKK